MAIDLRLFRLFAAVACALASSRSFAADVDRNYQLQLGAGFAAPYNLEEPFIDLAKTRGANWQFYSRSTGRMIGGMEAINAGYMDAERRMPTPGASSVKYATLGAFLSGAEKYPSYYADEWTLDWTGDGFGFMQRWQNRNPADRDKNSVTYKLNPRSVVSATLRFSNIDGLTNVRLYRKKNKALLDAGEIWNPEFIKYVRRYDIIRTMDLQWINNTPIRKFDQIATLNEPWGQKSYFGSHPPPFFSIPYEALFNLGVKSGTRMWVIIPPEIGATINHGDKSLRRKDKPGRLDKEAFANYTANHANDALASPEWENFAQEFVERLIASNYPLDRPLYVELGNEVWNGARGFFISTYYAIGTARSFHKKWRAGHGYGVLTARWMIALENEFKRRSIDANIIYVIGTHTANPARTRDALEAFKAYLKLRGKNPANYLPKTGVAVTNYYGHFRVMSKSLFGESDPKKYASFWIDAVKKDPVGLSQRVSDYIKNGPVGDKADGPWLVAAWKTHKKIAESEGSRFIGAYEGGSHLDLPNQLLKSKVFMDWWFSFHWGREGAAIAREINRRLIREFPGTIIANYKAFGELNGREPWFDGHYAKTTPMMRMWDEFARPH